MRKLLASAIVTAALVFASGASAQPLGIGTSPQGTMVYTLGAAVSKALADSAGIQSRVQPSSGTGTMVPLVNSGEIDIGFCNTLEFYDSFHGVGSSAKRPNPNLRAMAVLFPIQVALLVRNDSPIKSIKDIRGKTISYGYASQEVIKTLVDGMLANAGMTVADVRPVLVPNLIRGVDELMSGRVEVSFFALGQAKVAEADASVGVRFLPVETDPAAVAAMKKVVRTVYVGKATPAPHLPGVRAPIAVAQYDYVAFANAKLPADRVKTIVGVLADKHDAMSATLPLFKRFDVNRMYSDIGAPYHDGALAYFREKGIKEAK
ncbi:MAG TPA: TAXI family TRAP transporter solute-binding subunit [Xanthobacteraceae bacterium]|nr:TAXI family TRAP transporter solute-binding subunit [Xanthobacteraceae bacterium]